MPNAKYYAKHREALLAKQKGRYQRLKAHYKVLRDRHTAENRAFLVGLRAENPCTDCRQRYPYYVMEFDHAHGPKKMKVSAMTSLHMGAIIRELSKCDIVCANCHRARTHFRRLAAKGKAS
jgi:hypothetical protein